MKGTDRGAWHEILGEAMNLEPGEIAHFIVAVSTVHDPGAGPNFFFATCCDDKRWPTHMLEHLVQALAERN